MVCAMQSAIRAHMPGGLALLRLDGMLSLSVGAKVSWLEVEDEGSYFPRSLQCVLVLSALRALRTVSKVGISMR